MVESLENGRIYGKWSNLWKMVESMENGRIFGKWSNPYWRFFAQTTAK
jgi:hypothetical protein